MSRLWLNKMERGICPGISACVVTAVSPCCAAQFIFTWASINILTTDSALSLGPTTARNKGVRPSYNGWSTGNFPYQRACKAREFPRRAARCEGDRIGDEILLVECNSTFASSASERIFHTASWSPLSTASNNCSCNSFLNFSCQVMMSLIVGEFKRIQNV